MYERLQKELQSVREENEMLKCELSFAKDESRNLEKLLVQVRIFFEKEYKTKL